jgi:1-acyl-sn-glycerol-3-phosphate acyltransferase
MTARQACYGEVPDLSTTPVVGLDAFDKGQTVAKGVLGNDPFQRGAASRDLPAPAAPPAPEHGDSAAPMPGPTAPQRLKPRKKPLPPPRVQRETKRTVPPPPPAVPGETMIRQAIDKVLAEPLQLDPSPPVVPPSNHTPTLMGSDPVQHPASPEASLIDGQPTAHSGSPVLEQVLGGATVAHAGSPSVVASLDEPAIAHSSSPEVVAALDQSSEAVPHRESPELMEDRVRPTEEPPRVPLAWGVVKEVLETGFRPMLDTAKGVANAARDAVGLRGGGLDHWGKDEVLSQKLSPLADFLYSKYWRVTVEGAQFLPKGPCLVVANHSGALPFDGPVLHSAIVRERPELKEPRWLVEDQVFFAPLIGRLINRVGGVRASPENATRLIQDGHPVIVFPEGILGLSKPYAERYQLKRFGRGGYVKLAARLKVPIIPAALVGAAETMPVLAKLPGAVFGVPYIPVAPPPLPVPWKIRFGEPIHVEGTEHDLDWVQSVNDDTREVITALLHSMK